MKILATSMFVLLLSASPLPVAAQTLDEVLLKTAYRNSPELATEADARFARAAEISSSKFANGTHKEFRAELDKAAILGHEGAAELLCFLNSSEALGIAFFRQGYFWCQIARAYFAGKDVARSESAERSLAYVTKRLGPENLHLGKEYEEFMVQKILDAAASPPHDPPTTPDKSVERTPER